MLPICVPSKSIFDFLTDTNAFSETTKMFPIFERIGRIISG